MCKYPVSYQISDTALEGYLYLLPGTFGLLLQQDNLPGAELCGQGRHTGETQRTEAKGGEGRGDWRDQPSPAGSQQHEETGKNLTLRTVRQMHLPCDRSGALSWRPWLRGGQTSAPLVTTLREPSWTGPMWVRMPTGAVTPSSKTRPLCRAGWRAAPSLGTTRSPSQASTVRPSTLTRRSPYRLVHLGGG